MWGRTNPQGGQGGLTDSKSRPGRSRSYSSNRQGLSVDRFGLGKKIGPNQRRAHVKVTDGHPERNDKQ